MGPNAIEQILGGDRFAGAMESIKWLTTFIDDKFTMFISLVAFFIISAALLRNVVAGAYAAYPKFWDMIADAKENLSNRNVNLGGTDVSFLMKVIAFFIPNLKAMSDFHDNNVEPKHYFIVAIPKMIATVMIGVVIFNGYYRSIVVEVAEVGQEIIVRTLAVDPVAVFDRVFEATGGPAFASEGDESTVGKYTEKMSKDVYGTITTYYTDVKSEEARSDLARNIEEWLMSEVAQHPTYWNESEWKISYQADRVLGEPVLDNVSNGDTETRKTVAYKKSVSSMNLTTQMFAGQDWWVRVIVRFDKQVADSPKGASLDDLIMKVPKAYVTKFQANTGEVYTKVIVSDPTKFSVGSSGIKIGGYTVTAEPDQNALIVHGELSLDVGEVHLVSGNFVVKSSGEGGFKTHDIKKISIVDGNSGTPIKFIDEVRKDIPEFELGEEPQVGK